MQCPQCRFENLRGARFCSKCATRLGRGCPNCDFDNLEESSFCSQCGTRIEDRRGTQLGQSAARPGLAPAGGPERRLLTVVFCDLVGSTALSQRLDPEEFSEVIVSYRAVCADCIRRYGGYIGRYFGDGLLIYFGYPRAHDDDAIMAVRAALAIRTAVQGLRLAALPEDFRELNIHMGIHTGLVIAGELGRGDIRVSAEIVGDTPNIAARLEEKAEAGAIVISQATHQLVAAHFNCQPIGYPKLKGVAEQIAAFRVLSERDAQSRHSALKAHDARPLIGRERELEVLLDRWRAANGGFGQASIIVGEPGIGKSRLVRALREELAQPHTFVHCVCSSRLSNSAFFPIIDLLERLLGFGPDDLPEMRLAKLEAALDAAGLPASEVVPFLAFLLSVPTLNRYPEPGLSASGRREKTMDWVLDWLLALAGDRTLLFAVEDLHWADASTLDLVAILLDRLPKLRILLLLTFRPEFQPGWANGTRLTRIDLTRLTADQVMHMLENLTDGKDLPRQLSRQIVEKAEGVPLFVEEMTKMAIEVNPDSLTPEPSLRLAIPATLQGSLTARLDRLGRAKATAQLAATLGREFPYDLLQAVSPLEANELEHDLSVLVDAELLDRPEVSSRAVYNFKHSLMQEAAYDSLLRATRRKYHYRVADALVRLFPEITESRPELIADHYTSAGDSQKAFEQWRRAGHRALGRSANVEATSHLQQAIELIKYLPPSLQRDQDEAALQIALGTSVAAVKGFGASEVEGAYARARTLCSRLGEAPQIHSALRGLEAFYQVRGPLGAAKDIGEQLLRMAKQSRDHFLIAEAQRALGWCLFCLGELAEAERHLTASMQQGTSDRSWDNPLAFGIDNRVMALANLAWVSGYLGRPAEAFRLSERSVLLAREVARPQSLAYALCVSAAVHQGLGATRATQYLAEQTIALSKDNAFSYWNAWATILLGWALAQQGQAKKGMDILRSGLAAYRATGAELFRPYSLGLLAETCGKAGGADEGLDLIAEALDSAFQNDAHFFDAELHRVRADLLLMKGVDEREVEICLTRAIEVAEAQSAWLLMLRALISLNRLSQSVAEEQTKLRLVTMVASFRDGIEFPDLVRARTLLQRPDARREIQP